MIEAPIFSRFRLSEHIQFLSDVTTLCDSSNPKNLKIKDQYDALKAVLDELNGAFKKEQGSDLTTSVEELDLRRDNAIVCLSGLCRAYTKHFDAKKIAAAEKLVGAISKYGNNIARMNYQAETSTLANLVNDLESVAELKEAVTELGVEGVVNELKESNSLFNERYLARVKEMAGEQSESTVDLRKESLSRYADLAKHIEAHSVITGGEAYDQLVSQLNELIGQYNSTVLARQSTSDKEDKTPDGEQ